MDMDSNFSEHPTALNHLQINLPTPYLREPQQPTNELGLANKQLYTTADLCSILELHPDTFRARIRSGRYPEPETPNWNSDKRRFTKEYVKLIIKITDKLKLGGVFQAGKQTNPAKLNELGLPEKEFYSAGDICCLLGIKYDRFRYLIKRGYYPSGTKKKTNRREFTKEEKREILRISRKTISD